MKLLSVPRLRIVPEDQQLSIAIGRGGQNVRLGIEARRIRTRHRSRASAGNRRYRRDGRAAKAAKAEEKEALEASLLEALEEHGE